jgi:SAM-dependent methyltransferase
MRENNPNLNPTQRFSDRVHEYIKYRPNYPKEIVAFLSAKMGLNKDHIFVDVGSRTGISSELILKNGNTVYGIEPNSQMREASQNQLQHYKNFHSISGTAEATTLNENFADFILAAQAFHWFDLEKTKVEFLRILKNNGWIILMWNHRRTTGSDFLKDYEALIEKYGNAYKEVKHINIDRKRIDQFLGPHYSQEFYNDQELNFEGLLGRLVSSSYIPKPNDPSYTKMHDELKLLFANNEENGLVKIEYDTQIFYCKLTK